MAVKTFKATTANDSSLGGDLVSNAILSETDQAAASRADGWTVGKIAALWSANFNPGTKQTTGAFSPETSLAKPSVQANTSSGGAFRTPDPLTGTFAAAAWTFTFALRAATVNAQRGRILLRVYKGISAAEGSSVTQLTSAVQVGTTTAVLSTSADQTSVVTWNPGAFTLTNEYLFFVVAWEITTAGGSNGCDVLIRTGQAAGGSRIVTPDLATGPTTHFGATSSAYSLNRVTAAQRQTTSSVAMPVAFAAIVAGQVTAPAVTHYGALAAPFAFNAATAARRRTTGVVALSVTFTKAVAGQRKTFGATATPLTFARAVAAQRRTFGALAAPYTFAAVTAGIATTGAVTHYGQIVAPFTFLEATQATRKTFGQTVNPYAFASVIQGRRRTTSSITAPFTFSAVVASRKQYARLTAPFVFGETTAGRKHTYGAIVRPFTFGAVTAGIGFTGAATHFGATTTTITFSKAVQGTKKTFGAAARPTTWAAVVQGRRTTKAQVAVTFTFNRVVQARRRTFSTISRPITFTAYTNATSTAGGPILNNATDIRWGTIQADRVLVGTQEVWTP